MSKTKTFHVRNHIGQMDENSIYIGRQRNKLSHWGNPFVIGKDGNRNEVIFKFREWILGTNYHNVEPVRRQWIIDNMKRLEGKKLFCFCSPQACHGDVYIELIEKLKHSQLNLFSNKPDIESIIVNDSTQQVDFHTALQKSICHICKSNLEWINNSRDHFYWTDCCNHAYTMRPVKVNVNCNRIEKED